jgi:membrane protease YdiL (CAAX protease family)
MFVSDQDWPVEAGYGVRCFLFLVVLELVFAVLGRLILPHDRINSVVITILARMMDMILIGFFLRNKNLSFSDLGLDRTTFRRGFFHAFLWSTALLISWFIFHGIIIKSVIITKLLNTCSSLENMLVFFIGVLFGPAVEEVVFRGWLYGALRNRLGTAPSVFISSILFSFAHGQEGSQVILTFFGGILFSLSYEKSRNLITPMILHSGGNAFFRWWFSIFLCR